MPFDRAEPSAANQFQAAQIALIAENYRRLTRRELLLTDRHPPAFARAIYHAPFVLLAHDAAPDPVFFYANLTAQRLFEMNWSEITRLPSRRSADPLAQDIRQELLDRVARDNFIDDYAGVRVSRSGRRFRISGAAVWNLHYADDRQVGQAATFAAWEFM